MHPTKRSRIIKYFSTTSEVEIDTRKWQGTATVTYFDPGEAFQIHSASLEPPDSMELNFEFHDHDGKYIGDEVTVDQEIYDAVYRAVQEIADVL